MYSSNGNHINIIDPIFLSNSHQQPLLFPNNNIISTTTTTSKQPNAPPPPPPPFTFSNFIFPNSPLEDINININNGVYHQQYCLGAEAVSTNDATTTRTSSRKKKEIRSERCSSNRSSRRDRHSKIKTAKGVRDRRMRLSVEVAKRFFGLQDMLGFDKPSKTLEWLLNQAKSQINNLVLQTHNNIPIHSGSESELHSDDVAIMLDPSPPPPPPPSSISRRKIKEEASRKVARESRVKARERARQRTKEKMILRTRKSESNLQTHENVINPSDQILEPSSQVQAREKIDLWSTVLDDEDDDHDYDDHSLVPMINKWSPSIFFNSLYNSGFFNDQFSSSEFQYSLGKQWDLGIQQ